MKKLLFLIILSLIIYTFLDKESNTVSINIPESKNYEYFNNIKEVEATKKEVDVLDSIEEIKKEINLDIPFTSQAPTTNWEQPYQDACEEASILMVDYYYSEEKLPKKEEIENILKEMVNWQEKNWEGHFNLSVNKVQELVKYFFGYTTEIIKDLDIEKIETYLDNGIPVIVPANGKELDNPNFSNGGPEYHMLVIKGYTKENFITNDPGTRNGFNFVYTKENLLHSIADWDTKKSHTNMGFKNGLIILPN